jgi:hypothetical protein
MDTREICRVFGILPKYLHMYGTGSPIEAVFPEFNTSEEAAYLLSKLKGFAVGPNDNECFRFYIVSDPPSASKDYSSFCKAVLAAAEHYISSEIA